MEDLTYLFIEYLDGLYYDGYALQLAADSPASYHWEYNNFCDLYSPNPKQCKMEFKPIAKRTGKVIKHPAATETMQQRA